MVAASGRSVALLPVFHPAPAGAGVGGLDAAAGKKRFNTFVLSWKFVSWETRERPRLWTAYAWPEALDLLRWRRRRRRRGCGAPSSSPTDRSQAITHAARRAYARVG